MFGIKQKDWLLHFDRSLAISFIPETSGYPSRSARQSLKCFIPILVWLLNTECVSYLTTLENVIVSSPFWSKKYPDKKSSWFCLFIVCNPPKHCRNFPLSKHFLNYQYQTPIKASCGLFFVWGLKVCTMFCESLTTAVSQKQAYQGIPQVTLALA